MRSRQNHFLAHTAVCVHAKHLKLRAAIRLALSAGNASAAMEVGIDGTKIARNQLGNAGTEREHFNAQFMAEDTRVGKKRLASFEGVQVGSTDAYRANTDEGFPGPGGRRGGKLSPLKMTRLIEGKSTHDLHSMVIS